MLFMGEKFQNPLIIDAKQIQIVMHLQKIQQGFQIKHQFRYLFRPYLPILHHLLLLLNQVLVCQCQVVKRLLQLANQQVHICHREVLVILKKSQVFYTAIYLYLSIYIYIYQNIYMYIYLSIYVIISIEPCPS